ncbi:MAG TPA: aromatic amino acid transport family protein [Chlamydiales bacterium]|nr:aromatic amino acid transport family protein [Chlamydiales bacterium]
MRIIHSMGHVVGGTLLIAGTTIGVGMLALPVATGPGGFFPSMAIYLVCWAFMLCTGLLLVEISLWMPKDTSFISMAEKLLGPVGRNIFWVVYLFLFVTVMIAHAAGGGAVLLDITGWGIPDWAAILIYSSVLAPVVYLGARSVDRLNMFLISGVIICYVAFIAVSIGLVNFSLISYSNWGKAWVALPILFTSFTYQVIIPTLMTYMERNVKKVRLAILFGSSIPLAIYLIWEFVILGIVPTDGLIEAGKLGQSAIGPLRELVPHVHQIGKYFAFFSLTTSFIPLALSFFDFLADGFKWKKKGTRRIILCAAVFGVPMIIAIAYPGIFLIALGYAGGISCAFLFGLMPPVLAWVGRYIKGYPKEDRQLPGGKWALIGLMVFAFLILIEEVVQQIV